MLCLRRADECRLRDYGAGKAERQKQTSRHTCAGSDPATAPIGPKPRLAAKGKKRGLRAETPAGRAIMA